MKINDAREIDSLCWQIRTADYERGKDRARIDQLFGGWPPYTQKDVQENHKPVNVNFGEPMGLAHDARSQFNNAFLKPANYFSLRTDAGPLHKRDKWGYTATKLMNRPMKRSIQYFECFRSKFALDVLHGIGPAAWPDQDRWCPEAQAIADIGIPARTLLQMNNLPFFYVYRAMTQPELVKLTRNNNRDPGWNMPLVNACLEWLAEQTLELSGQNWQDYWSPEKVTEAVKGDGGFFMGDQVPTVNAFDFYYYDDDAKETGWRRRIILDAWSAPSVDGALWTRKNGKPWDKNEFLYTSKNRVFARKRENIVSFQFADLSAVAPFQYHSVRSLGFLLYAVCHLQNRLRCAFSEAVFENLLQMFRIKSMDDVQRALKLKIHGFSFIDDNLSPVPPAERFQPNMNLVELGIRENAGLIQKHASSMSPNQNFIQDRVEKTAFQVMAETNATTALVSAGLQQAYAYQNFEYMEIVRRFFKKDSRDMEVNEFRAGCLTAGIPEKYLVAEAWDAEPEQVMGAGNKTLEMAISKQLMEWRPLYNPTAQNDILRKATLSITGDAKWSDALVPEQPKISQTVHDSELTFSALMGGTWIEPIPGLNSVEVAGTVIRKMGQKVQEIKSTGAVGTRRDLVGLSLAAKYAGQFIAMLAEDKSSKEMVTKLNKALTKIMNDVRGFAQRQAQMAQAQAQQNGQPKMDPKDAAKIQATQLTAAQKVKQMKESSAARTAQRTIQFQQQMKQDAQRHGLDMQKAKQEAALDLTKSAQDAAIDVAKSRAKLKSGDDGD
jgi:hypothetical protein